MSDDYLLDLEKKILVVWYSGTTERAIKEYLKIYT